MESRPTAMTWSSDSTLVSTSSNDSAPGTPRKDQVLAFTTQDPTWKAAWEKYELSLTDDQKDTVLIKGATLQEVLETAELLTQRQRKGKRYSISQIIKPFLDGLKRFEGVFNVYAQISPMILGSLWGSVKIVLLLANGFVDTFELLSGVLAKAGEKLRKVERLADLFPEATTMKSILYDVYAKIIEIIATVIAFFNRKGIKSLWRSFWGDVERKLNSLVDCLVDRTADADQEALLSFFKKSNDEVAENKLFREAFNKKLNLFTDNSERSALIQAEQRAQVLKWLDAPNHNLTKEKVHGQRTVGTGDWLLQKTEVREFCKAQSNSVVWVHGSIGSGKSTLASHAVEIMQKSLQDDEALFYYFCSFQEPSASEMNAVLRSFIVQALERKPNLLPHIFATMAASGELHLRSPGRILSLLAELLEPFGVVRIVIDGLDECPDAAELVNSVLTLIESDVLNLNLLVFSREDSALHRALGSHVTIAITPDDTMNDMTKYLEESLEDMEHLFETDEDSKEVKDTILHRANGVFLWVRLVVDSLQNASFPEEVDQLLNDLPVGLDSALTRFFDRLVAPGAPQAKLVAQTLEYLVVSQRALSLDEICGLLSLRPETKHIARGRKTDRLSQILHRLLGPVIRITKPSNSVELVHLSIKEFLSRHKRSPVSMSRATEHMTFGCLACLNNSQIDADCLTTENINPLIEKDTLLNYALVYWGSHFNTCSTPSTHVMNALKQFLTSPDKVAFWLRVLMTAKSESTGEAVTNDLLLLESHMRAVARTGEIELPQPVMNGSWLTELFQLILNRFVSEFGENDLRTLQWYAALGKLNIKYDLCEAYLKRAIEGFKIHAARGPEHPETVTTMVALGRIYWNMSRLNDAEEVLQQCCDFREAELGKDDPDTLEAFSWVATIHRGQGHHTQACEEYEYVIKILQRLYGRQNRVVMRELRMLGVARRYEGSYDMAEALFKECLIWSSNTLGEKHPETVQAAKNLAMVYQMQGRLSEAEQIHRDVIAKQLDVTGEDAEYFISLSNLGGTLLDQKKVQEAEAVLWKALRGKDQWHGVDHPNTRNTLDYLARLYKENPDFGSATDRDSVFARLGA